MKRLLVRRVPQILSQNGEPAPQSSKGRPCRTLGSLLALISYTPRANADSGTCPKPTSEIATDRPDITNSSLAVPEGSFQSENGINVSHRNDAPMFDGTNTRLRLGVAPCLEVLADIPNYVATLGRGGGRGGSDFGFTDVIPAVKWQISPEPGKFDLSLTAGLGLPTGAKRIAGPGFQPYIQFPWSRELEDGWGLSGMVTEFFHPSDSLNKSISEMTFVIEKKLTEKASVFAEYAGDYPDKGSPSQLFNSGAVYHLTRTEQLDMHLAIGLNHNAPDYTVGIGYSFRLDGLF